MSEKRRDAGTLFMLCLAFAVSFMFFWAPDPKYPYAGEVSDRALIWFLGMGTYVTYRQWRNSPK